VGRDRVWDFPKHGDGGGGDEEESSLRAAPCATYLISFKYHVLPLPVPPSFGSPRDGGHPPLIFWASHDLHCRLACLVVPFTLVNRRLIPCFGSPRHVRPVFISQPLAGSLDLVFDAPVPVRTCAASTAFAHSPPSAIAVRVLRHTTSAA
jgi:hypothetical protein